MPNPNTIRPGDAMAAVKQNSDALQYVRDDTLYDRLAQFVRAGQTIAMEGRVK